MNELPVWVGGKEKIVGGLNRHTRCEDVIGILLQDRYKLSKCELSPANLECYALFEKWRGCERQLSPRTRMYKLWKAWGAERDNVKFTLRKSVAISKRRNSLDSEVDGDSGGIKLRDKTKQVSSQGQYNLKKGIVAFDLKKKTSSGPGDGGGSRESKKKEKRRRSWADESDVGFSDVRILCPPPLDCDSSASTSSSSGKVTAEGPTTLAEEVEGKTKLPSNEQDSEVLIQMILKQSHQLHNLLETISTVDTDIEKYETMLHNLRMQVDGRNYVQEAYLSGSGNDDGIADDSNSSGHCANPFRHNEMEDHNPDFNMRVPPTPHEAAIHDLEEYTVLCDRLFHADEQLRQTQDVVSDLAQEISQQRSQQEDDSGEVKPNARPRRYEKKRGACSTKLTHNRAARDIGFARTQLERSADTSMAQRKEIDSLQDKLHDTENMFKDKYDRLNELTNELAQLERDVHDKSAEDDEIRECVEQNQSTPDNLRSKNSSMESSLDQGIGHDYSPIDMTNRKSPSRSCDTDSSSDTGLSSLHSQDESEQMVYNIAETLV